MQRLVVTLLLVTLLFGLTLGLPGILDELLLDDECTPISEDGVCFIGFDEEKCNKDDWDPFKLRINSGPTPFDQPASNPLKEFFGYKDGIESLVLRKGCKAILYKDINCLMDPLTIEADGDEDLIIQNLSLSEAKTHGKSLIKEIDSE